MIPSYFKIEILAMRDEFVTQGHKGLNVSCIRFIHYEMYFVIDMRIKLLRYKIIVYIIE